MDKNNLEKPYRVLCLDGGGMRGLYTATVLHTLMRRYLPNSEANDKDIGKFFDLIVGTSTGGILATALASSVSTRRIIDLYSKKGKEIFPDPAPSSEWKLYKWAWRNRSKPAARLSVLKEQLYSIFDDETILTMYNKNKIGLCIPTVNISTNKAWVFKTPHNPSKHRDDNYKLVDVCMATAAAPLFFPLISLKNPDTNVGEDAFVDGGLWANNPILIGLVEALEMSQDRPIEILSVGTCPPPSGQVVTQTNRNRGVAAWKVGIKIIETSLDAQSSGNQFIAGFLAKQLSHLGKKCEIIRLPQTPPSSEQISYLGLDQTSEEAIQVLSQLGKSDGELAHSWSLTDDSNSKKIVKSVFTSV